MPRKRKPRAPAPPDYDLLLALLYRLVSPLKSIPVQATDSVVYIRPEDVAYITIDGKHLVVCDLEANEWKRFDTIADMEKRLLPDPRFFRSHRSYIVNLYALRAYMKVVNKEKPDKIGYDLIFRGKLSATQRAKLAITSFSAFKKLMAIPDPVEEDDDNQNPTHPTTGTSGGSSSQAGSSSQTPGPKKRKRGRPRKGSAPATPQKGR